VTDCRGQRKERGRPRSRTERFQRTHVATQPSAPLSDETEVDCAVAREERVLENVEVPLTTTEAATVNATRRCFVMFQALSGIFLVSLEIRLKVLVTQSIRRS
jgi:hypothetical protein